MISSTDSLCNSFKIVLPHLRCIVKSHALLFCLKADGQSCLRYHYRPEPSRASIERNERFQHLKNAVYLNLFEYEMPRRDKAENFDKKRIYWFLELMRRNINYIIEMRIFIYLSNIFRFCFTSEYSFIAFNLYVKPLPILI